MKGFKTVAFGLLVALVSAALPYFETLKETLAECGVNAETATEVCALPSWAGIVLGGVIIALRAVTRTSMFKKD